MALSATRTWPSPLGGAELFDGAALRVAAQEVHAAVRARGIALQHVFDEADRLDVLRPVERRAEAEAGHRVRHRDLRDALPLVLAANRLLGGRLPRREVVVDGDANRRQAAARTRGRGAGAGR